MKRLFPGNRWFPSAAIAIASVVAAVQTQAATVTALRSSDNVLQANFEADGAAAPTFLTGNSNARRLGPGGGGGAQRFNAPVFGFTLPAIPMGDAIDSAIFSVTTDASTVPGFPATADEYGGVVSLLGAASTADISGADFVEVPGPTGLGAGNALVANFAVTDITANSNIDFTISGDALAQLNSLYDINGMPSQSEVFFRLTPDTFVDTTNAANDNRRLLNLARDTVDGPNLVTRSLILETSVTAVPEPTSMAVLGVVGVGAMAHRRRKKN